MKRMKSRDFWIWGTPPYGEGESRFIYEFDQEDASDAPVTAFLNEEDMVEAFYDDASIQDS